MHTHLQFTLLYTKKNYTPHVGLLLQLFSNWYDLDVTEEDAFLKWKEDISHAFLGKEKVLFQINTVGLCLSQEKFKYLE